MRRRRVAYGLLGFSLLLGLWQWVGRRGVVGRTLPAFSSVLAVYEQPSRGALLLRSAAATVSAAGTGFALGAICGVVAAVLAHVVTVTRPGLDRLAVLLNAVPVIALGPVLILTVGRRETPAALASVPVFFLLYSSTATGLRSTSLRLQAVFATLGASRWQRMRSLEMISALPSVVSGLKIAVGSAMIGAIVGEWFGAPTGLGIVVLNSMQNFQIPLMWATVLVITAITLTGYALLSVVEQALWRRLR